MTKTTANRYHDISMGHRVVGHEGKCRHLHGHNYRVHFHCEASTLDSVGRVIDFSVIKDKLCMWLEDNWDHKFVAWHKDSMIKHLEFFIEYIAPENPNITVNKHDEANFMDSIVWVNFNPTAENLADHLLRVIAPEQLRGTGVMVTKIVIEETRKCSVTCEI